MAQEMVQRIAFKAVILNDKNQVLMLQESGKGGQRGKGRYHFPGGRLELGEHWRDGLQREAHEEIGQSLEIFDPVFIGEWRPTINGVVNQIIGVFVRCSLKNPDKQVVISDEHMGYAWLDKNDWRAYDVMDPDDQVLAAVFRN